MNYLLRPRNWEPACGTKRSAASANNMAVLTGDLGCSFDVGTCPERSEGGQVHPATYRSGTETNTLPVAWLPARLA